MYSDTFVDLVTETRVK